TTGEPARRDGHADAVGGRQVGAAQRRRERVGTRSSGRHHVLRVDGDDVAASAVVRPGEDVREP
ncbi:MAG: hypothetical protein AVDCRST_MAG49-2095, partial [uncultured Thermomicrobiales bacterium]